MPAFQEFKDKNPSAKVIKVNCDESPELASCRNVTGFPTVHVSLNGRHTELVGRFDYARLSNFVAESNATLNGQR